MKIFLEWVYLIFFLATLIWGIMNQSWFLIVFSMFILICLAKINRNLKIWS